MKIGILTFHFPNNYGALLQSYALSTFLINNGFDVEIVDYQPSDFHECFFAKRKSIRTLVGNIIRSPQYFSWAKRRKKLNQFRLKNVYSARYNVWTKIDFSKYDIIVTGSDQTFNINYGFTEVYYQPFPKKDYQRKIAYAPSFGTTELNEETKGKIEHLIKDFDWLSCREDNGATFLSSIVGYSVQSVLDPVFLLTNNQWISLVDRNIKESNYIFIYDLNGKERLIDLASKLFPSKRIIVYSNDRMMQIKYLCNRRIHFKEDLGVEELLTYIYNSDCVATDSFHGLAMSLILQKSVLPFIALRQASSRITSLLSRFKLEQYAEGSSIIKMDRILSIPNNAIESESEMCRKQLLKIIGDES